MELKENDIVIFRNNKKEEGSKQPDYTGKAMINGQKLDVSLWIRHGKETKFFSGQIKNEWKKENRAEIAERSDLPF